MYLNRYLVVFMALLFHMGAHAEQYESSLQDNNEMTPELFLMLGQSGEQGVAYTFNGEKDGSIASFSGVVSESGFTEPLFAKDSPKVLTYKTELCVITSPNGDKQVYRKIDESPVLVDETFLSLSETIQNPQYYRIIHELVDGQNRAYYYGENGNLYGVNTEEGWISVENRGTNLLPNMIAMSADCRSPIQGPPGPRGATGPQGLQGFTGPTGATGPAGSAALEFLTTFEDAFTLVLAPTGTALDFGSAGTALASGVVITQPTNTTISFNAVGAYLVEYVAPAATVSALGTGIQFQLNGVPYRSNSTFPVSLGAPLILQTIVIVNTTTFPVPQVLTVNTTGIGLSVSVNGPVSTNVVKIH